MKYLYVPSQQRIFAVNELTASFKRKSISFKKSTKIFSTSLLESRRLHPFSSHLKEAQSHSSITVTCLLQKICIWMTGIKPVAADEDNLAGYPSLDPAVLLCWLGLEIFFMFLFLILPRLGKNEFSFLIFHFILSHYWKRAA